MVTTNALDLVLPKAKGKTDSNKIQHNKKEFFIDKEPVSETELNQNYYRYLPMIRQGNYFKS
jgi:hypothetical protein